MRRISAQYIFDGKQYHKLATLVIDEEKKSISQETNQTPYTEHACVEFYNGVVCFNPNTKSDIVLLENFDFSNFKKSKHTKETILIPRKELA